jgi:TRAP-type C4-dicarboxylate transport system substrate-binding protein
VIGAYTTHPETINSRKLIATHADLRDQKNRTNNKSEAAALVKLGAVPVVLALNQTAQAISSGTLDAVAAPPFALSDAGITRLVTNHYFLLTGSAPLALVMNRKVFDRLPAQAKSLIQKHSGKWAAARYIETFDAINDEVLQQIKSDSRRKVVTPSPADLQAAQAVFKSVTTEWLALDPRHSKLLAAVENELGKIRSAH